MFVSKLIDKLLKPQITKTIDPFGEFSYSKRGKDWICFSKSIFPDSTLEISFNVDNAEQDLTEKIKLTLKFLQSVEILNNKIYEIIAKDYANKPIENVKEMWFLSAINLEKDNKTWLIVFEPSFDVETIYNHFLRFTVINNEIVWKNF